MRILLTGDTGYIGTQAAIGLRKDGHQVVGLDTDYFENCFIGWIETDKYPRLIKDIRDIEPRDLEGYDAVVHLAGLSNDVMGDISPELTQEINLISTMKLAEYAKMAGVRRFIFASSCSVYGASNSLCGEEDEIRPLTTYAKCKAAAEFEISRLADKYFSPTFLRNATVFGYSQRLRTDLIVNTMVANAYTSGEIKINGDGSLWRPLVHVNDVVRAILMVLDSDATEVHDITLNVGHNSENYTVGQVAEMVKDALPATNIIYVPSDDTRNYRVSFDKIETMFPKYAKNVITVQDGIYELVTKLKYYGRKLDITGQEFIRLKYLNYLMENSLIDSELCWTYHA